MTTPILQNAGLTLAQSLAAIRINPAGALTFNPSSVDGPDQFVPIHENAVGFADLATEIFTTAESLYRPSHLGITPVFEGERSTLLIERFSVTPCDEKSLETDPTLAESDIVRLGGFVNLSAGFTAPESVMNRHFSTPKETL